MKRKYLEILREMAKANVESVFGGTLETQYPISSFYVFPLLSDYSEQIFSSVEKNYKKYHATKISQILLLLFSRELRTPRELFFLLLDDLIKKREDPTLKNSLRLRVIPKHNKKITFCSKSTYQKNLFFLNNISEIKHPILRGFGYEIFEDKEKLFQIFFLNKKTFVAGGKILKKPKLDIYSHVLSPPHLKNFFCSHKLPTFSAPKTKTFEEKLKYASSKILMDLGVKEKFMINKKHLYKQKKLVLYLKKIKKISKKNLINSTFNNMRKRLEL